jgi:hypothetical protein
MTRPELYGQEVSTAFFKIIAGTNTEQGKTQVMVVVPFIFAYLLY